MEPGEVFTSKAEKYARFRWSYAPQAIQAIFDITALGAGDVVADIGAGTGILTRALAGKAGQVYAIEPNPQMRRLAAQALEGFPECVLVDGRAETTTLLDHSVDLITAAQAVHWFEPEAARLEFYRILKKGGWIAFCRNNGTDEELGQALQAIFPPELDTGHLMIGKRRPKTYYFCGDDYRKYHFPFSTRVSRDAFLGSLLSASSAPDDGSEFYSDFVSSALEVFERFSKDGLIELHAATELHIGQISCA
jgi:SAM-dependent methyltransferase